MANTDILEYPTTTSLHLVADWMELGKVRLTAMVVITTGVGFILGSAGHIVWLTLLYTVVGTWMLAAGAAAINEILEINPDSRMNRTKNRPLPAHRMSLVSAWLFAGVAVITGATILLVLVNPFTSMLGLLNLGIYAFVYTPLKRRTSLNTLVGAVCGGIPPIMGFTAATGRITAPALLLGTLLFVWQIPHFLSLAWMYREEYRRAGFKMLPLVENGGPLTCRMILSYSLALIPLTMTVALLGIAGGWYIPVAPLAGMVMVYLAIQMMRNPNRETARRVFLASVTYLPLILVVMVAQSVPHPNHWNSSAQAQVTGTKPLAIDHGVARPHLTSR